MKKFINFLLGLVMFNAIIALGIIISFKTILSENTLSKVVYTLLETNKNSLDSIALDTDDNFSKYIDKDSFSKALGKYVYQSLMYNTEVSNIKPNKSIVIEEIRKSIKKYNKNNKDQISEDVADTYGEKLTKFDKDSINEKSVIKVFKIIYSKKVLSIIIAVILICLALILVNSDINKVFFHLGLTTIISSILLFVLLLIATSLLKSSSDFNEIKSLVDIIASKIRNIGIYSLLIGIVSMTLSKVIPKREIDEKKELA